MLLPDGRLGHAEILLGDCVIMLSDEFPEFGSKAPSTLGGSAASIHLYVDDVDAFFQRALAVGAKELKPVMDQFYGAHSGQLEDPFGHLWWGRHAQGKRRAGGNAEARGGDVRGEKVNPYLEFLSPRVDSGQSHPTYC